MTAVRDKFWLWGQDAGSHHAAGNNVFQLPGVNRMSPLQGAQYLGINNCCRVVMGGQPQPPFEKESEELSSMDQVVWSIIGDYGSKRNDDGGDDLEEVLRQARMFPNVTGAILDDFFSSQDAGTAARIPIEDLKHISKRLHSELPRPLDLWIVYYENQLDRNVSEYLNVCDVVTFWTWKAENLKDLEDNYATVRAITPDKRHLIGCYMYDYGNSSPMPVKDLMRQCETCLNWIKEGNLDGMIFCSNCIADIGLEAVEWTGNWISEIGDDEI